MCIWIYLYIQPVSLAHMQPLATIGAICKKYNQPQVQILARAQNWSDLLGWRFLRQVGVDRLLRLGSPISFMLLFQVFQNLFHESVCLLLGKEWKSWIRIRFIGMKVSKTSGCRQITQIRVFRQERWAVFSIMERKWTLILARSIWNFLATNIRKKCWTNVKQSFWKN